MPKPQNCCPWCGVTARANVETCDNCEESLAVPDPRKIQPVTRGPVFRTVREKQPSLEGLPA